MGEEVEMEAKKVEEWDDFREWVNLSTATDLSISDPGSPDQSGPKGGWICFQGGGRSRKVEDNDKRVTSINQGHFVNRK